MDCDLFDEDHELFRASVREFVDEQVVRKLQQWDADRLIDRETSRTAARRSRYRQRPRSLALLDDQRQLWACVRAVTSGLLVAEGDRVLLQR
jgi:acyl-CoA dehydrogenase